MATVLNLLKSFQTGQGVSGGLSKYLNYPQDHDANYTSIETTVNQLISEVASARLTDSQIPTDLLLNGETFGRYSAEAAAVSRSTNTVTISSGLIYANGRRVLVVGQAFDFTGLPNGTYYIYVDTSGLLNSSTSSTLGVANIATVVWDGSMTDSDVTDNLYDDGRTLNGFRNGIVQEAGTPPGGITDITNTSHPKRLYPDLRYVENDGSLGDAGFFAGGLNQFAWLSGPHFSTGFTVISEVLAPTGQSLLMEQARVFAARTTNQSIATGATWVPVSFDAPAANGAGNPTRREPQSYFANPFHSAAGSTLTIPADSSLGGTYLFTAMLTLAFVDETFVDAQIIQTSGGSAVIARCRVASSGNTETVLCLSGMFDFLASDAWELQIRHDGSGAQNLTSARLTAMLVGGGV